MASSRYTPGVLFRQNRLQNLINNSNLDQNREDFETFSDYEASQPDQVEFSLESASLNAVVSVREMIGLHNLAHIKFECI